jgi:protoporphyrinogen oxidase
MRCNESLRGQGCLPDINDHRVVIIGAGPAGLAAGYELARNGYRPEVLEADSRSVGGLARTVEYRGFRFDIGGHRFFSKNPEIEALWTELLGDRMRECSRLSRVYYNGRFFKYPLEPLDALRNLGPLEALRSLVSYLRAQRRSPVHIRSFEDWVESAFGPRLYQIFFKTYTEKVWGIPCSEISADWAVQRIRGLSLVSVMRSLLRVPGHNGAVIKTLVDNFRYPVLGPGEMWQKVARMIEEAGGAVRMGQAVREIHREGGRIVAVTTQTCDGPQTHRGDSFVSTMPLVELIAGFSPPVPEAVMTSARGLRYRDFITVALIIDEATLFPDNWIYIHDPGVRVGRIQNFKNWSAEMVPDPRFTVLGLEYFCSEKDALWSSSDEQLIAIAKDELATLGLADKSKVVDGAVVRQPKAYPLYDHDYRANVTRVREFLAIDAPNLQVAGRNGMHKYDNQDHAMMTGLMAARNIMGGSYDLWRVNSDAEYLESEDSVSDLGRALPNPIEDEREVWGIPALDAISMGSGYIGAAGVPLIFDLVVYQVLIYYFHVWYPIAFAVSCLAGATVQHYGRKNLAALPWSRRALVVLADGVDCYLINIGLIMLIVQNLHRHATIGRALAAGVITLLAFIRENLLAMQRRHLLVAAEQKVLR